MPFFPHTSGPRPKPLEVLIPIYPDFNTFDINGPVEVLSQANRNSGFPNNPHFKISIAAETELTTSVEGVRIARDISLSDAIERLSEWDILLVPGGTEKSILSIIASSKEEKTPSNEVLKLLDQYTGRLDGFVLTVCTGSLFLGALGKLVGRRATTHWASLTTLKKLSAEFPDGKSSKTEIVRARWVDSGADRGQGLRRLITAGGVACGIDATFYLLDLTVGTELAEKAARRIDYQRRGEELQEDYVITD